MIRAARLDQDGVYQGIDELDALTPLHVPQITECDLPAGKYRWIADAANPFGGAFHALAWLDGRAADQQAISEAQTRKVVREEAKQLRVEQRAAEVESRVALRAAVVEERTAELAARAGR